MDEDHTKRDLNEKLTLQQARTLDSLIEVLIRPRRLKRDLFFALLFILMRENDFLQIKAANGTAVDITDFILTTRKRNEDTYEATFFLNNYRNYPVKILAIPLSNVIVLNALIPDTNVSYSVCIDLEKFIVTSNLGIPHSYSNQEELERVIKSFTTPIKNCIFNRHRILHGGLLNVPEAVILKILLYLRIRDVLNLSETCKKMNCVVKEDLVWCRLYNRDFSDAGKYDGRGWLDMYRVVYFWSRRGASYVQAPGHSDYAIHVESPKWEIIL